MLVSVNTEQGTVTVYGNTVVTLPLTQAAKLRAMLVGRVVEYVSEVVEATGEEVLGMIAEITRDARVEAAARRTQETTDGRLWLHATGSGYLNIPAAGVKFSGSSDFRLLEKFGYDFAERHPQIKALMDKKLLEVVTTDQMQAIKKANAKRETDRDRSLNRLIVDLQPGQKVENMDLRGFSSQYGDEDRPVIEVSADQPASAFVPEEVRMARLMGWGKEEEPEETEAESQA